MAKILLFL